MIKGMGGDMLVFSIYFDIYTWIWAYIVNTNVWNFTSGIVHVSHFSSM